MWSASLKMAYLCRMPSRGRFRSRCRTGATRTTCSRTTWTIYERMAQRVLLQSKVCIFYLICDLFSAIHPHVFRTETVLAISNIPPSLFMFNSYDISWTCNNNPDATLFDVVLVDDVSGNVAHTVAGSLHRLCLSNVVNTEAWSLNHDTVLPAWIGGQFRLRVQVSGMPIIFADTNPFLLEGLVSMFLMAV